MALSLGWRSLRKLVRRSEHACVPRRRISSASRQTVALNSLDIAGGSNTPVIFIHGLYGAAGNFRSIMKQLSKLTDADRPFHSLDLRNHGASPWSDDASVLAMAADVREFIESHDLGPSMLVGHSLGGRTAMATALHHSAVVDSLMVVDMSPETGISVGQGNGGGVAEVGQAMYDMPVDAMQTRKDAEAFLATRISTPMIRSWLLQNLVLPKDGNPHWRLNIETLTSALDSTDALNLDANGCSFNGPTVFLRGERSPYVDIQRHGPIIQQLFPRAKIRSLDTGHWVHSEDSKGFIAEVLRFILEET